MPYSKPGEPSTRRSNNGNPWKGFRYSSNTVEGFPGSCPAGGSGIGRFGRYEKSPRLFRYRLIFRCLQIASIPLAIRRKGVFSQALLMSKQLPNIEFAQVDQSKVVDYLLNTEKMPGAAKARFFKAFGFQSDSWEQMASALVDHAFENPVVREHASRESGHARSGIPRCHRHDCC